MTTIPGSAHAGPDVATVLDRIKEIKRLATDAELAEYLGYSPSTIAYYRMYGSLPYARIVEKLWEEDLNFVFKGVRFDAPALTVRLDVSAPEGVDIDLRYR